MNSAGSTGFRLHPLTPFLAMEKAPHDNVKSEYRFVGPATVPALLDALSSARGEGFQVVRLYGDEAALLERRSDGNRDTASPPNDEPP